MADLSQMKAEIAKLRQAACKGGAPLEDKGVPGISKLAIKNRRVLKGHFAKIYAMHWAEGAQALRHLVSASQVRGHRSNPRVGRSPGQGLARARREGGWGPGVG